jgi:hypothetical protein
VEQREFEKLITIAQGQRVYCTVCKTFAYDGEFYKLKDNKYIGRHVTCIPKNVLRPDQKEEDRLSRALSRKRRRAGGHGYSGGDGWVPVK